MLTLSCRYIYTTSQCILDFQVLYCNGWSSLNSFKQEIELPGNILSRVALFSYALQLVVESAADVQKQTPKKSEVGNSCNQIQFWPKTISWNVHFSGNNWELQVFLDNELGRPMKLGSTNKPEFHRTKLLEIIFWTCSDFQQGELQQQHLRSSLHHSDLIRATLLHHGQAKKFKTPINLTFWHCNAHDAPERSRDTRGFLLAAVRILLQLKKTCCSSSGSSSLAAY